MADAPLSDDQVETMLHDLMRQIVNTKTETALGREMLRLALVGPYGALMRMEKVRNEATGRMPGEPLQP
jgi:hypothetical protein